MRLAEQVRKVRKLKHREFKGLLKVTQSSKS